METTVYGKCILTGDHAVLRGVPALVFPVFARALKLQYRETGEPVTLELSGDQGADLRGLFFAVIEKGAQLAKRPVSEVTGHFSIESDIRLGAGMGASAALCASVGRWFHERGWVDESRLPEYCRLLENLFHGESSGLDVAVALSGRGLHYQRGGDRYFVDPMWQPNWFVSYSGKRGITSECIAKVKALWETDRELASALDEKMRQASHDAEKALKLGSSQVGFRMLADAINLARECFEGWGLTDGPIGEHVQMLLEKGASAVKPTGSGDGGFVLSLWSSAPPVELADQLISLGR